MFTKQMDAACAWQMNTVNHKKLNLDICDKGNLLTSANFTHWKNLAAIWMKNSILRALHII